MKFIVVWKNWKGWSLHMDNSLKGLYCKTTTVLSLHRFKTFWLACWRKYLIQRFCLLLWMPQQALWKGLLEEFLKLVRVFKEASKNLPFDFLSNKNKTKMNKKPAHILTLIYRSLNKIFISWHSPFKEAHTLMSPSLKLFISSLLIMKKRLSVVNNRKFVVDC